MQHIYVDWGQKSTRLTLNRSIIESEVTAGRMKVGSPAVCTQRHSIGHSIGSIDSRMAE